MSANNTHIVKQKLVIIGYSHARKIAAELQHNIGSAFSVSSFIKPGAVMKSILDTMKDNIKSLQKEDVIIIWGGSNDIGKNNSKDASKHLCDFIKSNQKVNIVVMNVPPRHDLPLSSCVNREVLRYNNQLRKRIKQYDYVKILETDFERKYFTKHGLHLNLSGKEYITLRLAAVIQNVFHTEQRSPISLHWIGNTEITYHQKINKDLSKDFNNVTDSGSSTIVGRNNHNQESEISKDTTVSNKQTATDVSDLLIKTLNKTSESESVSVSKMSNPQHVNNLMLNTHNKISDSKSDSKMSEPQHRLCNRTKNPSKRNGDFLWT